MLGSYGRHPDSIFSRRFDTCCLVVTRLVRAVSRAVTVAVFADGLRCGPPASQDSLPDPRRSYSGAGSRIAPVGSGRCAGWRRRACALRRSGAELRRGAVWRSHPARCSARRRPACCGGLARSGCERLVVHPWDHQVMDSARAGLTPGAVRASAAFHTAKTGEGPALAASRSRWIQTVIVTARLTVRASLPIRRAAPTCQSLQVSVRGSSGYASSRSVACGGVRITGLSEFGLVRAAHDLGNLFVSIKAFVAARWVSRLEDEVPMPTRHRNGLSSELAVEEGVQVGAEGFGVRDCAVDVGGGAGAEYRHAENVESGGAGDHPAVVADVAGVVTDGDVQPGVVGPEACRPQQRGDLSAGQVQLQGSGGIDLRG